MNIGILPCPHQSLLFLVHTACNFPRGHIPRRSWIEVVREAKAWQLITGKPSCDCGWLCVWRTCMSSTHHDLLMWWYWLSPVLQAQFLSLSLAAQNAECRLEIFSLPESRRCHAEVSILSVTLQYVTLPWLSSSRRPTEYAVTQLHDSQVYILFSHIITIKIEWTWIFAKNSHICSLNSNEQKAQFSTF